MNLSDTTEHHTRIFERILARLGFVTEMVAPSLRLMRFSDKLIFEAGNSEAAK